MQVVNKHDKLLVEERGVFGLRKDRLGHGRRHHALGVLLSFRTLALQTVLSDIIIDSDQVLQL